MTRRNQSTITALMGAVLGELAARPDKPVTEWLVFCDAPKENIADARTDSAEEDSR